MSSKIDVLTDVIGISAYIGPIEESQTSFGTSKYRDILLWVEYVKQIRHICNQGAQVISL
jgi:hypothetical protein